MTATSRLAALDPDGWIVVDDAVMGGRSEGHLSAEDGHLVFHGVLRTRGGGFTSVRSTELAGSLEGRESVVLRVRGDGRRYACDLRKRPRIRGWGVTWRAEFDTADGAWTEVVLPLTDFVPTWRGRTLDRSQRHEGEPFWFRSGSVGFILSDGIDGPFRLEVGAIRIR